MPGNLYKSPMFRKGGSAEGGITSGLRRPGYNVGERVTDVMSEMRSALPQRNLPKRRFNDFLIDFGLDIASRSPQGNIFNTIAASAKDPFSKFQQSRSASEGFEDQLALGAYDIVKDQQAKEKEFKDKEYFFDKDAALRKELTAEDFENRRILEKETSKRDFENRKKLVELEAELNPKLKKVFREEIPEVRINNYADSLQESDFDFIKNNSMEIAQDIVTYNVFKEKNPDSDIGKKNFRGILPYEYDKKGNPIPNYESIAVGQVFYNPEDGLFYERIAEEGIIGTDFKALDPFTYD